MVSREGWTISLFLGEGFPFDQGLEMTLSQGEAKDLDRETSAKVYRSLLQEILQNECFRGARVEVLTLPGDGGFQHHVSGPGGLTDGRREEAVSKLYRKVYELWQSREWLVWKGGCHQPGTSAQNQYSANLVWIRGAGPCAPPPGPPSAPGGGG
jgi:hypothetical protein